MRLVRRALVFVVTLAIAGPAAAATCPFNIPVVTLPPQTVAGVSWGI